MATATAGAVATVDTDRPPPLPLDSIPTIDLSLLSQSELLSLSMCSNSSFDFNRCDDVVIPKIDRSVFNESAGSRKQTYSRLRLAPAESSTSAKTTIHRRTPHLRSSHAPISNDVNDPGQAENSQVIRILKELFKPDHNFEESVPIKVEIDTNVEESVPVEVEIDTNVEESVPIEVEIDTNVVVPELPNHEMNRKRGHENAVCIHPPAAKRMRNNTVKKVVSYDEDMDKEIVNRRGEKINVANLGTLEDPYGLEIRRRTEGMSTEDELLGFLRGLNGKWGTSRKRKRVVDASDFGDALPKGWRLSLSIKKKEGRAFLFCHHYISPSGRPFESCKEISIYLHSVIGEANMDHTQSKDCDDFALKGASGKAADLPVQKDLKRNTHVVLALASSLPNQVKTEVPTVKKISGNGKDLFVRKDLKRNTHFVLALPSSLFKQVKSEASNVEKTSEAPTLEKTVDPVDPVIHTEVSQSDDKISSGTETKTDNLVHDVKIEVSQSDDKISSGTETKTDNLVHDVKILDHANMNEEVLVEESGDKFGKNCNLADASEFPERDKAPDVSVSKSDFCLDHEASMSVTETNEKYEISVETFDFDEEKSECILEQSTSVIEESLHEKKCLNEEPQTQMNTENSHIENDFQVFRNNKSVNNDVDFLGTSENGGVMDFDTEKNLEFDFQDIFGPPLNLDGINELSFSFEDPNGLYEDTFNVEEKKDGVDCSVVPSKSEDTLVNNETLNNGNVLYESGTWEDSRVFTYEQGFDSSFWSGKNGVCPWCGNEFQFQAMDIDPATQGAIGSLCPTCSAGISGEVNML